MNIGQLNKRLAFQSATETREDDGQSTYTWTTYDTVWGSLEPISGKELENARQISEVIDFKSLIRYNSSVLSEHRISYDSRTFEIVTVLNHKENNEYQLLYLKEIA